MLGGIRMQCPWRVSQFLFDSIPVFDWASINGFEGNFLDVCPKSSFDELR